MREDIEKAKELLGKVRHAAMATVNPDGSPHNTPLFFIHSPELSKIYWGSHKDSQHSKNIIQNNRVFVVLFDSFEQGKGGVYITANNAHELGSGELTEALEIHNQFRAKYGKVPLEESYYTGSDQRMYAANIQKVEVYSAERDDAGQIKKETRIEVSAKELLNAKL